MEIEDLQEICNDLIGTTTDIKWEDHLCFNVGAKMYLVTSPDKIPHSASFKVTEQDFHLLCEKDGFSPAPYLARYKWVYVDDINRLDKNEWKKLVTQSYQLIYNKLPAKVKKEIQAN